MRLLLSLSLLASSVAYSTAILPISTPTFNGAITGSAPPATTIAAQLPELNGVQGVKLYLQNPFTGVPLARSNASLIAILETSGVVVGTSSILAGTPFTISYDFTIQHDPGITLNSITLATDIYTPSESSVVSYLNQGHAVTISGGGTRYTGSFGTLFLNTLTPGTFVTISVFLSSNFSATSGQNITLIIPDSSIDFYASGSPAAAAVPEPATAGLFAVTAAGLASYLRGRRRKP